LCRSQIENALGIRESEPQVDVTIDSNLFYGIEIKSPGEPKGFKGLNEEQYKRKRRRE